MTEVLQKMVEDAKGEKLCSDSPHALSAPGCFARARHNQWRYDGGLEARQGSCMTMCAVLPIPPYRDFVYAQGYALGNLDLIYVRPQQVDFKNFTLQAGLPQKQLYSFRSLP